MKKSVITIFTASLLGFSSASALNLDTVRVGDAGNQNDTTGYGGVNYEYNIGKYEVTNSQYVEFLNSVANMADTYNLYNPNMTSGFQGGIVRIDDAGSYSYNTKPGFENKPVNYVSFWDAARFTNWLTTGGTETGVYNLGGVANPTNNTIMRDAAAWNNGGYAIASENEWYKAAYYQPVAAGGDVDNYWRYPTASNSITTEDANYGNPVDGGLTDVGSYSDDASYYGTFDQGGNVREWNDEVVSSSDRGLRGGSFFNFVNGLQSSDRINFNPRNENFSVGFRVSSLAAVPDESSTVGTLMIGILGLLISRRFKGRRTL